MKPTHKKIQACIFDLGGTVCDKYVLAPATSFKKTFNAFGLCPTMEQIRRPMGKRKNEHINELLLDPDIQAQWLRSYKRYYTPEDVENMYQAFIPVQMKCAAEYSDAIPGTKQAFDYLQANNILTGSTTGYTRPVIDVILDKLSAQGNHFQSTVG